MLAIDIAAGKLTTPLPDIQVRQAGYVAVVPDHAGRMPVLGVFIDWLSDEGQHGSPASSGRTEGF
jgi:LysR family glycine cleavage system transcriptional activator